MRGDAGVDIARARRTAYESAVSEVGRWITQRHDSNWDIAERLIEVAVMSYDSKT